MINDQVEVGDFLGTFLKETSAELNHVCFWETHQFNLAIQIVSPTQHTFCRHQYPSQSKSFRAGRDALSFQTKQNTNYYYYKAHLVEKESRHDSGKCSEEWQKKRKKKMQAATCGDIYIEHLHLHTGLWGPFFLPFSNMPESSMPEFIFHMKYSLLFRV